MDDNVVTTSPILQERLKAIKKTHGGKELGKVTVDMAIGGMRGITVRPPSPALTNAQRMLPSQMNWLQICVLLLVICNCISTSK